MIVISEDRARELVGVQDALDAVERCFSSMALGSAKNLPVVREKLGYQDAVFGVKSGVDVSNPLLGLKAGGYWPHNATKGMGNHQSVTVLFDPDTGQAEAVVSANYLTGVRTGAASAIATRWLSRTDSQVLALIGAGVQAGYQLEATVAVRDIKHVKAWDPSAANLERLGRKVRELGLTYETAHDVQRAVETADIVITVTPSSTALVQDEWVKPGTHINAMGADTRGKQELDPKLVARSALYYDELLQSIEIGECQHAWSAGLIKNSSFRGSLGDVINDVSKGRLNNDEVTLFDGTGVGLQDLVVARIAVDMVRHAQKI